jgi:cytochrome oxidase Cu insertion factor (SCO1/SenC/PrrC family)
MSSYLAFAIDPYQDQPAIYYETSPNEIIFDGFSSLTFNLYAQELVYFKMFALIEYMGGDLEQYGDNNFEELENAEGVKIFDDYCNYLIDQE